MTKLPVDWIKKFQSIIDKMDRHTTIYNSRCQKEVFTHRLFYQLKNKAFKLKINGIIHYALFSPVTITGSDYKYKHNGISFHLGWSNYEYEISFINERGVITQLYVKYNDILHIEYEEISLEKFYQIMKLFIV